MAKEKKATEYKVANYDGSLRTLPEPGLSGSLEVKPDGVWQLNLGFRKHAHASFAKLPFEVAPLSDKSCRITIRSVDDPAFEAHFDLSDTAAEVIEADLAERGFLLDQMMAASANRRERQASGEWWAGIGPYRIVRGCHYSGARKKEELGDLEATATGLYYKAVLGSKVSIPWQAIQDIEVSTQSTRRVTAGRVVALGVFALAAKKNETYTYLHVSDSNTVWSFATKLAQPQVLAKMKPILDAFNSRAQSSPSVAPPQPHAVSPLAATTPQAASQPSSVADELTKLAKLMADGLLSEEEFAAQKAKLLS